MIIDEFINLDSKYRSLLRDSKALGKRIKRNKGELKQALKKYEKLRESH